jgi:uncharacterized repeat protein (TIGR04138 family)
MQKQNFAEAIEEIIRHDPRFDRGAYAFVREGLDYTVRMLKKNPQGGIPHRHVTGQELLEGLRRYALEQFGPMAKTVLEYWGITQCEDFGNIVFQMVEKGVLGKTDQDSPADFKGGYSFEEAFVKPYRPAPRPAPRQTRPRSAEAGDRRGDQQPKPDSEKLSSGSN